MKQQNFFEDPKGVLQDIQQQSLLLQQQQQPRQQDLQQQPPQQSQTLPQQRRRLSTFTAPSMVQPSPSMPINTTPSPLVYPSTGSLGSEQPQPSMAVNRRPKPGILRLDMSKPRRSSGGSVEFRMQPHMYGANTSTPTGTTPPPHQLSVTWATPPCGSTEREFKTKPSTPVPGIITAVGIPAGAAATPPSAGIEYNEITGRKRSPEEKPYEFSLSYAASNLASPVTEAFIDFPLPRHYEDHNQSPGYSIHTANTDNNYDDNDEDDDEEDYSVSVSAIMQRRASVRGYRRKSSSRNSRRASSPMDHVLDNAERRRSSVYTTSSDEGTNQESTQEQIFENIRLHKEVIQSVKLQPWPIRKKLKLVRQAKTYVARHEGALQERFAMSRSTRDLWARFKIVMAARWRHWKRETYSFLTVLIPWELRIKEIESHFGSGVASYFTFLRWLMYMNVMIALPLLLFVIGPEYFATKKGETDPRKKMSRREENVAGNLLTIWEFEGYLKYSPMFYGYYSSFSGATSLGYLLPLAYFLTAVVVYIYSFVATLRKMAENSRNSKLSSKDDECTFSWKLFTGWDFMIGHAETAHNRIASVVVGFKEALLEEAEKKKDKRNWRIILQRILVNILVIALLAASGYTVVTLVNMSEDLAKKENWLSKNAVNVTMNLLSFLLPMIFEALGLFENWHPRQQLRLQLARIMILNLLTLYSLMFSFIYKINSKEKPLIGLKELNDSTTKQLEDLQLYWDNYQSRITTLPTDITEPVITTTEAIISTTAGVIFKKRCYNQTVQCTDQWKISPTVAATTLMLLNLSTTMMTTGTTPQSRETMWTTLMPPGTVNIPSSTNTKMIDFESTTTMDLLTTKPLTTEDDSSTTPGVISTTTTEMPVNDTYFQYYEYFEGFPVNYPEGDLTADDDQSARAKVPGKNKRNFKPNKKSASKYTTNTINEVYKTTVEPQRLKFGKSSKGKEKMTNIKRVKNDGPDTASLQMLRKSKYSRRDQQDEPEGTVTTAEATEVGTSSTVLPRATTTNSAIRSTTDFENVSSSPDTLPTTILLEDTDDEEYTEYTDDSSPTTTSKAITWDHNEHLDGLLDFFTMKRLTTTDKPVTTTIRSEEDQLIDDIPTTPFYLGDEQYTGHTVSYDLYELDDGIFKKCVRTVCFDEPDNDTTTTITTQATPATTQMSPETEFKTNHTELMNTLKEIELNLTTMCWETSLGQELAKVVVLDGITATVLSLCIDFLRALFVRYVNQNWCWDMEKTFPQYGDFKIAENILALINNQGQVWMGIFFSPGLVIINLVKLVIMMYFRSWIVLTCNVPHEVVFKASKSNNFYLSLLLTMLFLCVLPVGYAVVWLRPSWHCGPYSNYTRISEFITSTTKNALPTELHEPLNYLTSSSTVIPLLLLLILIIYYLVSLTGALREANQDLRTQLQKEREEERKKFFKLPEIKPAENTSTTLTNRWRKVLDASSPVTPTAQPDFDSEEYKTQARRELISRIMKKALRKDSATSDEETFARHGRDDDTDTEHHDSLPHDEDGNEKRPGLSKLQEIRRTRKPSLVDIVQIANSERERVRSLRKHALGNGGGKSKPKVDKTEKSPPTEEREKERNREKEKHSIDNGNDPEIKTRVINERRQSLLRKKKEDEQKEADNDKPKENENEQINEKDKEKDKDKSKITDKKLDKDIQKPKEVEKDRKEKDKENGSGNGKKREKMFFKDKDNDKKDPNVYPAKLKDKEKEKEVEKDTQQEEVVKLKPPHPPFKNRIYESFRRKKREDKSPPNKQSSLEKTEEEDGGGSGEKVTPPNSNKKKSLRRRNKTGDDHAKSPGSKSTFKVVDEKSPLSHEDKQSPVVLEQLHNLGEKLKFKRHKQQKPSTEPEVFKFESDRINKEADIATTPTWPHLESELQSPRIAEDVTTPTSFNHLHLGADRLANLSRQSRRKIGSFLALMKDAVTRPEHETQADTAIEIPPTPRAEMSSALNNAFMLPVAMHTTSTHSIQPYIMPRAPLELPEDTDPPSYSHSMAVNDNTTVTPKDPEELDKPGPITFPQRGISQRRRPVRQDSQSSNWSSDNIPTITISVTPEGEDQPPQTPQVNAAETVPTTTTSPAPKVNVIKINIEQEK